MCTFPISIINPKIKAKLSTWSKYEDGVFMKVPCGKCESCQTNKQNEWLVRLAYEYEWTKEKKGFVLFDTFTYAPEHLPTFHGANVFNKEHYKTFMKKLRVYLQREFEENQEKEYLGMFYTPSMGKTKESIYKEDNPELIDEFEAIKETYSDKKPQGNVKVFWVSEYGGEYGRPHYHALFFVTYPISPWTFRECVRKAWIYGFTDKRLIEQMVINAWAGIAYVSKYITKNLECRQDLFRNEEARNIIKSSWETIKEKECPLEVLEHTADEKLNQIFKELELEISMPFTRASRNFGISGIEKITEQEWRLGQTKVPDKNKGYKLVNIPQYFKRKYMYDYDKIAKQWKLNDTGKILRGHWFRDQQAKKIIEIQNVLYHYIDDLQEIKQVMNIEYVKKVRDEVMNKGIARFANLLSTRNMLASEWIRNRWEKWDQIYPDIITNPEYEIDKYKDMLSRDKQFIISILERKSTEVLQDIIPEQERKLLETYDVIMQYVHKARARHLYKCKRDAERQKQIKNQLKPTVT